MNELSVKTDHAEIIRGIHYSDGLTSLPLPFEREVFLTDTWLDGIDDNSHMEDLFQHLRVQMPIRLVREPESRRDDFSIRAETDESLPLGYIPRIYSPILSRLMDAGKSVHAILREKEVLFDSYRIILGIYLKD